MNGDLNRGARSGRESVMVSAGRTGLFLTGENGVSRMLSDGQRLLVGTGVSDKELRLKSRAVSRLHALIDVRDGVCRVTDLGSRCGTYLNGRLLPIGTYTALKRGDELTFGDESFRFAMKEGIIDHYEKNVPDHDRAYYGQHPFVHYL